MLSQQLHQSITYFYSSLVDFHTPTAPYGIETRAVLANARRGQGPRMEKVCCLELGHGWSQAGQRSWEAVR